MEAGMRMKLVIADDELRVCQMIERLIDWKALNIDIVGMAANGFEAMELILKERPELVITDIRMPGFDGLELIKRIREAGVEASFVVISGHKQFEYAQTAMKYGVEDYLLKPISREELFTIAVKLSNRYLEATGRVEEDRRLKLQLERTLERLRFEFMNKLIKSPEMVTSKSFKEIAEEYHIALMPGYFQIAVLRLDKRSGEVIQGSYQELVLDKLLMVVRKYFREKNLNGEVLKKEGGLLIFLNYSGEAANIQWYKELLERLKEHLDIWEHFHITLGLGSLENTLRNIHSSRDMAIDSMRARVVLGVDKVIYLGDMAYKAIPLIDIISSEEEKEYKKAVRNLDKEKIKTLLTSCFTKMRRLLEKDPTMVFRCYDFLAQGFISSLEEVSPIDRGVLRSEIVKRGIECKRISEMQEQLTAYIVDYIEEINRTRKFAENKPVRIAREYVEKNYHEQITLETIAREVHLNPVYFSVIFKKEMGINFVEFLTNYRLERAKELLKKEEYNVSQVAYMVGYKDPKHFSKLFTRIVGVKPKEYKRFYS